MMQVGDRFIRHDSARWRDADGARHEHSWTYVAEVTEATADVFSYLVVQGAPEAVDIDAPTWFTSHTGGQMLQDAVAYRLGRGDMAMMAEAV